MANYSINPVLLHPHLPAGTEIDTWNNTCYVSLVGFMFQNVRIKGVKIPFHVNFEEVNLRFYVRYNDNGQWKRGVVFISEIVPRPAITFVANTLYNEKYRTLPMQHRWVTGESLTVDYQWKLHNWNSFRVAAHPQVVPIVAGSEEEFITEHYWGYSRVRVDKTREYGVEHPRWDVYPTTDYAIDVDFERLYGSAFGFLKSEKPTSVFLAEGSEVVIREGRVVT